MSDIIGIVLESLAQTSHNNLLESTSGLLYARKWQWQGTQPLPLHDKVGQVQHFISWCFHEIISEKHKRPQ